MSAAPREAGATPRKYSHMKATAPTTSDWISPKLGNASVFSAFSWRNSLAAVRNALESCQGALEHGRHHVRVNLPEGANMKVVADKVRLQQILENLILNPTLSDLVGGVHTVTLGDEEARRRGTPKTISERRAPPTFDIVVEMVGHDEVLVHRIRVTG